MANDAEETKPNQSTEVMKPMWGGVVDRDAVISRIDDKEGEHHPHHFANEVRQGLLINAQKRGTTEQIELPPNQIEGVLVGIMAEWISEVVDVNEAETIYGQERLAGIKLVTRTKLPELETTFGTKGQILKRALREGLRDSNLEKEDKDLMVEGLSAYDGGNENRWSLQTKSTLPDFGVVNAKGDELMGIGDVKAYDNEELEAILNEKEHNGVSRDKFFANINGWVNFYNYIKSQVGEGLPVGGEDVVVVIRFAADADNEKLAKLARLIEERRVWGEETTPINLVIQKLPLTRDEILDEAMRRARMGIGVVGEKDSYGKQLSKTNFEAVKSVVSEKKTEEPEEDKIEEVKKEENNKELGDKEKIDLLLQAIDIWKRGKPEEKEEFDRLVKPILTNL